MTKPKSIPKLNTIFYKHNIENANRPRLVCG
jgi:hypothetical protein